MDHDNPNPYELPSERELLPQLPLAIMLTGNADITTSDIRIQLAKDEQAAITAGGAGCINDVSPSGFIITGLAIEASQYVLYSLR